MAISTARPTNSTVNLQQIADLVKDNPGLKLKVTGYADSDTAVSYTHLLLTTV